MTRRLRSGRYETSRSAVYEPMCSGELSPVLIGARRRVRVTAIDAYVAQLTGRPDLAIPKRSPGEVGRPGSPSAHAVTGSACTSGVAPRPRPRWRPMRSGRSSPAARCLPADVSASRTGCHGRRPGHHPDPAQTHRDCRGITRRAQLLVPGPDAMTTGTATPRATVCPARHAAFRKYSEFVEHVTSAHVHCHPHLPCR